MNIFIQPGDYKKEEDEGGGENNMLLVDQLTKEIECLEMFDSAAYLPGQASPG